MNVHISYENIKPFDVTHQMRSIKLKKILIHFHPTMHDCYEYTDCHLMYTG